MKISQKIRKYRLERKMTLKATAQLLGVPLSTYRDWEYGRKIPAEVLPKLAEAFNLPLTVFSEKSVLNPNDLQKAVVLLEEALMIVRNAI